MKAVLRPVKIGMEAHASSSIAATATGNVHSASGGACGTSDHLEQVLSPARDAMMPTCLAGSL